MDLAQSIYKTETLGKISNSKFLIPNSEFRIDIAFGVDANYIPPMGIMLTSILMNNPNENFHVHVFLNSILPEDVDKLKTLVNQYSNLQIDMYYVDVSVFKNFHIEKGYTVATYHRIIIAKVLYTKISKLLYIDADTLCVGKISEFQKLSFDDKMIMAVLDRGEWLPQHMKEMNISEQQGYYNAGVLYIDLERWNDFGLSEKMMEILNERKLSFQDQDAINILAGDQIKSLPVKFNQFLLMKHSNEELPNDTIIIHFAGQLKPWQPWCENPQRAIYDEYRNKSLWKDFNYQPRDYQENRLMGKAARHNGDYSAALKWYYRYVRDKFKR
ncbi:MAG: hypothetical protein IJ728_05225 [Selenomonadaceae bacterium]|nr:hypothetical protein [Selenomonadaceae bacterium]